MRAWLITWEGIDPLIREENKIVAILHSGRSSGFVEDLIDLLFLRATESACGMAHYAHRKRERRSKNKASFSNGGRIFYGSNPFLYGRQVSELWVGQDEEQGLEFVHWLEPAYYRQNPKANDAIELIEPETPKQICRKLSEPIGAELST